MEFRTFFAQNLEGDALALATVTVWNAGTSNLAAIFKSNGDPQANPFQASSAGAIAFAARNGVYDIFVQENSGTATQQINGVRFFDPADQQLTLGDIDGWPASVTSAKLSYLGGVTGAIQPQLDGKVAAPEGSIVEFSGNIDDPAQLPVGFYQVLGDATGDKPVASFNLISLRRGSAPHGNGAQIAILVGTNTQLARSYNGSSWTPWAEFYTGVTLPQNLADIRDMTPSGGDIIWFDGENLVKLELGGAGQVLQVNAGESAPVWGDGGFLGVGQSFQDVAASRVAGTAYQNTTGRSIVVHVTLSLSYNSKFEVSNDGVTWMISATGSSAAGADISSTAIVPDGAYYRVGTGFINWVELR